jgi:hypothetical protein
MNSARRFLGLVILMGGLALLSLNTLALHPTSYVPGGDTTDYQQFTWNYWWVRFAFNHDLPIYETDYILYPLRPVNLAMHAMTLAGFPIWAALEPIIGRVGAFNAVIWLGVLFTGVWMFLLLRDYKLPPALALIGGVFLLCLPVLGRSSELAHINLISLFYYPLVIWLWRKIVHKRRIAWAVIFGVTLWSAWLTDSMWLLFLSFILPFYGLYTLIEIPDWPSRRRVIFLGALSVGVFLVLGAGLAPLRQVQGFDRDSISPADRVAAERFSVAPSFYLGQPDDFERGRSIGRVLMLAVVLTLFFVRGGGRERWFWLVLGLPMMILSLGPEEDFFGKTITMPYWLLHQALGGLYRVPERFAVGFVFCMLMFLALSWKPYVMRWNFKARLAVTVTALFLVIGDLRMYETFQAHAAPAPYEYLETIREDPADYVIMSAPVWMKSGWAEVGNSAYLQWYAMDHEKPIAEGYVSRLADFSHYYYQNEAVLGWLAGYQPYQESTIKQLEQYVMDWPIGYMIVYQDAMQGEKLQDILGILNGLPFLCPVTVERDAVFFRTEAHPLFAECPARHLPEVAPGTYEIPFGLPGDELFIGRGFYPHDVIGGPPGRWMGAYDLGEADLFIDLPQGDYTMTLEATAFAEAQTVRVLANGQEIGAIEVQPEGFQAYPLSVPANVLGNDGQLSLRLIYDHAESPQALGLSSDPRTLSIALHKATFQKNP